MPWPADQGLWGSVMRSRKKRRPRDAGSAEVAGIGWSGVRRQRLLHVRDEDGGDVSTVSCDLMSDAAGGAPSGAGVASGWVGVTPALAGERSLVEQASLEDHLESVDRRAVLSSIVRHRVNEPKQDGLKQCCHLRDIDDIDFTGPDAEVNHFLDKSFKTGFSGLKHSAKLRASKGVDSGRPHEAADTRIVIVHIVREIQKCPESGQERVRSGDNRVPRRVCSFLDIDMYFAIEFKLRLEVVIDRPRRHASAGCHMLVSGRRISELGECGSRREQDPLAGSRGIRGRWTSQPAIRAVSTWWHPAIMPLVHISKYLAPRQGSPMRQRGRRFTVLVFRSGALTGSPLVTGTDGDLTRGHAGHRHADRARAVNRRQVMARRWGWLTDLEPAAYGCSRPRSHGRSRSPPPAGAARLPDFSYARHRTEPTTASSNIDPTS